MILFFQNDAESNLNFSLVCRNTHHFCKNNVFCIPRRSIIVTIICFQVTFYIFQYLHNCVLDMPNLLDMITVSKSVRMMLMHYMKSSL